MKAHVVFSAAILVHLISAPIAQSATVSWTGAGGDAAWLTPANWSDNAVPTTVDDVVINVAGNPVIVVDGNATARSLQCQEALRLVDGSLALGEGASTIGGTLTLAGGTLGISGAGGTLTVSGPVVHMGGNITAANEATMSLPQLRQVWVTNQNVNFTVSGNGVLDLSAVTNVVIATSYQFQPWAYNGLVDLRNARIPSGTVYAYTTDGGTVDLSGVSGWWTPGEGHGTSLLQAHGGTIVASNVTALERVYLDVRNGGQLSFGAQLRDFLNGNVSVANATLALPQLRQVWVTNQTVRFTVDGNGVLDLGGVTNVVIAPGYQFQLVAYEGLLDLRNARIPSGSVAAYTDDGGTLDLSSLASPWSPGEGHANSLLQAWGGTMLASNVVALNHVDLDIRSGGQLSFGSQLREFLNANISVNDATLALPQLRQVWVTNQNVTLQVQGNGVLDLSAVTNVVIATSYQFQPWAYNGLVDLRHARIPAGTVYAYTTDGGTVDLSGVSGWWTPGEGHGTSLLQAHGGTIVASNVTALERVYLDVRNGGQLSFGAQLRDFLNGNVSVANATLALPQLRQVWVTNQTVRFTVDGNGVLDLGGVTNVVIAPGYQFQLVAYEGLLDLRNARIPSGSVAAYTDDGGTLDLSSLASLWSPGEGHANSLLQAWGGTMLASNVVALNHVDLDIRSGGQLSFGSQLREFLNANISVNDATLALPQLRQVWVTNQNVTLQVQGNGVLDLSAVTNVVIATSYQFQPWAYNGLVDLRHARIPAGTVYAYTTDGGTVDLSGVSGWWTPGEGHGTSLLQAHGGTIVASNVTALERVYLDVRNGGQLSFGAQLRDFLNGNVSVANATLALPQLRQVWVTNQTVRFTVDGNGVLDLSGVTNVIIAPGYQFQLVAYEGLLDLRNARIPSGSVAAYTDDGGTLDLSAITGLWDPGEGTQYSLLQAWGGTISLPNATALSRVNLEVKEGGALVLPNVTRLLAPDGVLSVRAFGGGALDLSRVTSMVAGEFAAIDVAAQSGGRIDLHGLPSLAGGPVHVLAEDAGSEVDLTGLSGFIARRPGSSLTARNDGVIRLRDEAFLLGNVAIDISGGSGTVLPPFVASSSSLVLYGRPWRSYLVEARPLEPPGGAWQTYRRVALTNSFDTLAATVPVGIELRVSEFIANPSLLDMVRAGPDANLLVLFGTPTRTYRVQTNADLAISAGWGTQATVSLTNSFHLMPAPNAGQRFFRAQEP